MLVEVWPGQMKTGGCYEPEFQCFPLLSGPVRTKSGRGPLHPALEERACLSFPKLLGLPLSVPPFLWLSNPGDGGTGVGLLEDAGSHPQHTHPAACPGYSSASASQSLQVRGGDQRAPGP